MLSTFSCSFYAFDYLCFKNDYSGPVPILIGLFMGVFFFLWFVCLFFAKELYEFFIYLSCVVCKYFLPFWRLSFHSVDDFFRCDIQKNHCPNHCQEAFSSIFFFLKFYEFRSDI